MNPNKKIIIVSITLGVVILVFIILVIYPLFNGIKNESENLISQKKEILELETKTENLKKFQIDYKTYQPNLEKIEKLFVNSAEPIHFIEFLEKEATSSQLSIKITPFAPREIKEDPWPSMDFRLTLTGSFPNFLKFLEKLELSNYLMEVLNLNIGRLAEEEGDITASLSIKVFTK